MVDGNFYQSFPWSEEPGVSWNIIYLDNDWAIEYDWYVLFSTLIKWACQTNLIDTKLNFLVILRKTGESSTASILNIEHPSMIKQN